MKILLIEDDSKKSHVLVDFLQKIIEPEFLVVKESYQSGLKEIMSSKFDLLLLDMSIPTYTKTPYETGGAYQKFGGYLILKELKRKARLLPTILVTMFDDFGEGEGSISIGSLDESLKKEFDPEFVGSIFYHARENKWRDHLKRLILSIDK